ncbi:MAG: tetratricopeptide repeat protein [Patescibacteria group bacterium]
MEQKNELSSYLESASLFGLGILLFLFPIFVLTVTTDAYTLPKQILLGGITLLVILVFGIKSLLKGQVIIKRTPFDIPVLLLTAVVLISSILATNKADALISFVPFFFSVLAFFAIVNIAKDKSSSLILATSLVAGAVVVSVLEVLSFLKIHVLPFAFTRFQLFTPLGSLLDQVLYLVLLLPLIIYLASPVLKIRRGQRSNDAVSFEGGAEKSKNNAIAFAVCGIIIAIGLLTSSYLLFKTPSNAGGLLMLPYETGFQTGFAEISQDTGRVFQGFLFGSGYGTYITDFTRFKQPAYNDNANIWNLTFFRSSSLAMELLATTGILGVISLFFLLYKILKNRFVLSILFLASAAALLLPFSFSIIALFFILLGIASSIRASSSKSHTEGFSDVELELVALQKGLISFDAAPSRKKNAVLPAIILGLMIILVGLIGWFGGRYVVSDTIFQKSLVAASQNNGAVTYENQAKAISIFPYRDAYYRIFSQTNLAIANSIASQQPQGSSPSAQTQQTILTLIQQSINAGRTSLTYGPQTMLNWQNLSSVYRSLIGFGQNADQFSILAAQQAIALDPNNPQEYINLGGIYYQLGQWDNAIRQFQTAALLKRDLANAYYNLGHALQEKGDLNNALAQYQEVQRLVAQDKPNLDRINQEIAALQKQIAGGTQTEGPNPAAEGQDLNVNTPSSQLPPQDPPVKIPGPLEKPTPTPTPKEQ